MTPILILAAGQSSRMRGQDKLLELVDGVPLIRRQCLAALATKEPVFVALPDLDHPRAVAIKDLELSLLPTPTAHLGLSASLKTGVSALPECPRFMVLLADLVGLTTEDLNTMIQYPHGGETLIWRGADHLGKAGHPIIFDQRLRPHFEDLTGDTGGAEIIKANRAHLSLVPLPEDHATLDLDTPEDWQAFRSKQ